MNEFLRKFDTIRFVAPWSIFRIFFRIFHFLNLNLNFELVPVWYRSKPEPGRTGLTGNRSSCTQGFFFRQVDTNRRPPVPVYRTSWTGNRLKPDKLKIEFKWSRWNGRNRLAGQFGGQTGPVCLVTGRLDWWQVKFNFFYFLFKFKCPQSILNKCFYNIF